jgi:hypothetical protein
MPEKPHGDGTPPMTAEVVPYQYSPSQGIVELSRPVGLGLSLDLRDLRSQEASRTSGSQKYILSFFGLFFSAKSY